MKCQVMVELTGVDGAVQVLEPGAGGSSSIELSPAMIGLTLADGKRALSRLPEPLVRALPEEYCSGLRRCSRGPARPHLEHFPIG
jgi:hypothetical protein